MSFMNTLTESVMNDKLSRTYNGTKLGPTKRPAPVYCDPPTSFQSIASTTPVRHIPGRPVIRPAYVPLSKKMRIEYNAKPLVIDLVHPMTSTKTAKITNNNPFSQHQSHHNQPIVDGYLVHSNNNWSEKYRPHGLQNFLGHQKIVTRLVNWMEDVKKHKPGTYPVALLTGPPGIGKTTLANAVFRHCGYEICEVNASDARSKASILNAIKSNACSKASMFSGKPKGLILDEVDGCTTSYGETSESAEDTGLSALLAWIKKTGTSMKQGFHPIICIGNDRSNKQFRELAKECEDIPMYKLQEKDMHRLMAKLINQHKIPLTPDEQFQMLTNANGDVRKLVGSIEWYFISSSNDQLNKNVVDIREQQRSKDAFENSIYSKSSSATPRLDSESTNVGGQVDNFDPIFNQIGRLLYANDASFYTKDTHYKQRMPVTEYTSDLLIPMVHENYLDARHIYLQKHPKYSTLPCLDDTLRQREIDQQDGDILEISHMLSDMDVLETNCFGESCGEGLSIQDLDSTVCVSTIRKCQDAKKQVDWNEKYKKKPVVRYTSIFQHRKNQQDGRYKLESCIEHELSCDKSYAASLAMNMSHVRDLTILYPFGQRFSDPLKN